MGTTTKRNIEALRQLRRVVAAAPDELLYMGAYSKQVDCGTAHCAAGWAALDPWFQTNTRISEAFGVRVSEGGVARVEWAYLSVTHRVLEDIFGLDEDEAGILFYPHAEPGKALVLEIIDALIAGEDIGAYQSIVDDGFDN